MDLVHKEAKAPVHDLMNRLRIKVFEHGRGIGHIREHDSNDFPLTFDGTACREDLVGKMLGGVRMRLVVIQWLGLFWLA
jgi:hypothetical protein